MSETKPQNFANHGRFDPWYHFFLAPIALIIFIASIVHLVRHPHPWGIVHVIVAFALVVFVVKLRTYPLKGAGSRHPAGGASASGDAAARTAARPHRRIGRSPTDRVALCFRCRDNGAGRAHIE